MSQNVTVQGEASNALGLAGLILSILGWFTCGLLCIPGTIVCFLGLFSNKPKGFAIAGLIVGFPGTLFFLFFGLGLLLSFVGASAASVADPQPQQVEAVPPIEPEPEPTEPEPTEPDEPEPKQPEPSEPPPTEPEPNRAEPEAAQSEPAQIEPAQIEPETVQQQPEPTPPPVSRVFVSADKRFSVRAYYVSSNETTVTLLRKDNGKEVVVPLEALREEDQKWIAEQPKD